MMEDDEFDTHVTHTLDDKLVWEGGFKIMKKSFKLISHDVAF
jgi:hypothetical protein